MGSEMSNTKKIRRSKIAQWADSVIDEVNNRQSIEKEQKTPETTVIKDVQKVDNLKKLSNNKLSTIMEKTSTKNNGISDHQLMLLKKDKEEEFLLQDENNRFVLFPIR